MRLGVRVHAQNMAAAGQSLMVKADDSLWSVYVFTMVENVE